MSLPRSARTVLATATVVAATLPLLATTAHAEDTGSCTAAPYAGLPSGTKQAKTLVIGIDAGPFDSTLVSPAYQLNGGARATLSYATNYRMDGPRTGDVHVSFDGGAPRLVKSYRANANTVEHLELTLPAGAKSARPSFRCTGTNSGFRTVDQVAFGQPNQPSQLAVASLGADTKLLGRPGSDASWQVTANGVVRTARGKPVKGAKVTAEADPARGRGGTGLTRSRTSSCRAI
ncbi:hypothetical protein ABT025_33155 [Streptomyces sp. NPDC002809]|uniref:hypothetical protein n=1 Tax=Streptomyces sp. NPDC002809 TaxID=3154433 RepID=UPI0033168803